MPDRSVYQSKYRKANLERLTLYDKNRNKIRQKADVQYRLKQRHRIYIRQVLTLNKKPNFFLKNLGCTLSQFKNHLASKFQPGMSWANRGEWHVDHTPPLSSYDLSDPHQAEQAFHYTHTCPMWGTDNRRKGVQLTAPTLD